MARQQPATVDRFKITAECEAPEMGLIIAQLTKMGLTNLHFELVTDVLAYRQKANHDIKAADFLTEWIKDHPTFKAIEACKHFEANGRTKGSAYPALSDLVEAGILKKLDDPGHYARADVKAIAPPKKGKKAKAAAPTQEKYAIPNHDYILRLAKRRKNGLFTRALMRTHFEKDGRPPGSVAPALSTLMERKQIIRISGGNYQVADMVPPKAKTNGNGKTSEPVAEAANG